MARGANGALTTGGLGETRGALVTGGPGVTRRAHKIELNLREKNGLVKEAPAMISEGHRVHPEILYTKEIDSHNHIRVTRSPRVITPKTRKRSTKHRPGDITLTIGGSRALAKEIVTIGNKGVGREAITKTRIIAIKTMKANIKTATMTRGRIPATAYIGAGTVDRVPGKESR